MNLPGTDFEILRLPLKSIMKKAEEYSPGLTKVMQLQRFKELSLLVVAHAEKEEVKKTWKIKSEVAETLLSIYTYRMN